MEHQFAVGQQADRFSVFADIADQHQPPVAAISAVFRARADGLAEVFGKADLIVFGDILVAEYQNQMIEPGSAECYEGLGIAGCAQIDIANLRAQRGAGGMD